MDIFQALAEPRRREIVEILAHTGQLTATAISDRFDVSPPAISQHLKVLREASLVSMEKSGRERLYQVNPNSLNELEKWVKQMEQLWSERFDRLEALVTMKSEI